MISPPQTWPIFMGWLWKFQDKDCHDAVTPGAWTPGAAAVRCPMCCEAHAGSGWGCKEQELVCCGTYWVVAAPLARSCWNVWWLRFWSRELVLGLRDCGYSFSSFCIFTNVFLYLFVSFCYIFFLVVAPTVDSFSMFFHVFHAIAEKQWMIILVPKSVPDKEKLRVVAYRNLVRNVCHPRQSCRRDRMVLVIAVHEPRYKLVLVNGPIFFW